MRPALLQSDLVRLYAIDELRVMRRELLLSARMYPPGRNATNTGRLPCRCAAYSGTRIGWMPTPSKDRDERHWPRESIGSRVHE
jgi:hypothetical protein